MTGIQLKNSLLYVCWWAMPATKYSYKQKVLLLCYAKRIMFLNSLNIPKIGGSLKMYFW